MEFIAEGSKNGKGGKGGAGGIEIGDGKGGSGGKAGGKLFNHWLMIDIKLSIKIGYNEIFQ